MAAAAPADAKAEAAKMDLLEDDDEFEEFEIDQGMCKHTPLPPLAAALLLYLGKHGQFIIACWRRDVDLVD